MSWFEWQWGHTTGKEEGRREGYAEARRQSIGGGGGDAGLALLLALPCIELLGVGGGAYGIVSGNTFQYGLHWHPIFGIVAIIFGVFAWFWFFTLPIIGSILNIVVSALWGTAAWKEFDLGWGILLFLVSLGMHWFILYAYGGEKIDKKREYFVIKACTGVIIFLIAAWYALNVFVESSAEKQVVAIHPKLSKKEECILMERKVLLKSNKKISWDVWENALRKCGYE